MKNRSQGGGAVSAPCELHLHPVDANHWIGVVYLDQAEQAEIEPMPSIEAVERAAAEMFGEGLEPIIWSQDASLPKSQLDRKSPNRSQGMILREH